jgi:CheY-like chemotaxis protein
MQPLPVGHREAHLLKPYILVVDDFPDGREMVAEYLAFRGFDVRAANHGEEAITMAIVDSPALILMDLN